LLKQEQLRQITNIGHAVWSDICHYFEVNKDEFKARVSFNIARKLKNNLNITESEMRNGIMIVDYVYDKNSSLFSEKEETETKSHTEEISVSSIDLSLVRKMSDWEIKARTLSDSPRNKLYYLATGFEKLHDHNRIFVLNCLGKMKDQGFSINEY